MANSHSKFESTEVSDKQSQSEERLFEQARKLQDAEERDEFLQKACGADTGLYQRLTALLAADGNVDSFLDHPENDTESWDSPRTSLVGQQIGNYKLLQQIGEGGFGVVYMAEQTKPVSRKVALKVIKPGMDTAAVVARFEAERQALAMMDHSHIARVFDGGSTDEGRPYFVMELVRGVPITTYCDDNRLTTTQRLHLFLDTCSAVQHAHQKGIIHRDIKPSNIMVTLHDGKPIIKVIDFGVAKATNMELTEKTLFTSYGQMIGTPQYMSPEQAEMSGLDIDTRSDIYSLGVVLYELLTGTTPLEARSLRNAGYIGMQKLIKDNIPPRPSVRLSTSGEKLTHIAEHRSVSPDRLSKEICGDLDWIVMRSLEKDRTRRYDSASRFAEDVQKFMSGDMVDARPPSVAYRVSRFCSKHRSLVTWTSLAFLVLTAFLGITLWQMNEVSRRELELADTVLQLRERLIESGLQYALNGDGEKTEEIIAALRLVEERSDKESVWPDLLRTQLKLYGSDPGEALKLADAARKQDTSNLTALAMYTTALVYQGNYADHYQRLLGELTASAPKGHLEKLFVGQAFALSTTIKETQYGEKLVADSLRDSPSGLALAIQAQMLGHRAIDESDKEIAKEALRKIAAANEFLPNNCFVRMILVSVHHTAFNLGIVDQKRLLSVVEEAGDFEKYSIGHLVVGMTYHDLKMNRKAEKPLFEASEADWWGNLAVLLLSEQRYDETRELMDRMLTSQETDPAEAAIKRLYANLASIADGTIDIEPLKKRVQMPGLIDREYECQIYALLAAGEIKLVEELAANRNLSSEEAYLLNFSVITNNSSLDEIRSEYAYSTMALANALFTAGLVELAKGNHEEAQEFYRACKETKNFFGQGYYDCQLFLELIEAGVFPVSKSKNTSLSSPERKTRTN